ncbi:UNVERIFIED_CONTAM: hypothetical protein FKN15_025435 [Acipenser sinensis]
MAGTKFHGEGVAKLTEDLPSGPEIDYDEEDIEGKEWLPGFPSHIDSEMCDQDTAEDEAGHEEREDSGEEADSDKTANNREEEECCTEIEEELEQRKRAKNAIALLIPECAEVAGPIAVENLESPVSHVLV